MARRFSDIKRAGRLSQALTAYSEYLARPPVTTLPDYKPRPANFAIRITPFGLTLPTGEFASVNGNQEGFDRLSPIITGLGQVAAAQNGDKQVVGFIPARLITFENATKTATTERSKFTNQQYRKYAGDRFACPFGAANPTDKEIEVAKEVRSAAKARTGLEVNRVSFTPERQKLR